MALMLDQYFTEPENLASQMYVGCYPLILMLFTQDFYFIYLRL